MGKITAKQRRTWAKMTMKNWNGTPEALRGLKKYYAGKGSKKRGHKRHRKGRRKHRR